MPRPTKYRPEYASQAEKVCRIGATDAELGRFFEVAESTVNAWTLAHPEFSESIKKGKLWADACVADALCRRAAGCVVDQQIVKVVNGRAEVVTIRKELPPDTTAAIFGLKNRQPGSWAHRQVREYSAGSATLPPWLVYAQDTGMAVALT